MQQTEVIYIRVTPELKQRLKDAAQRDNRSITNYVVTALTKAIEKTMDGE